MDGESTFVDSRITLIGERSKTRKHQKRIQRSRRCGSRLARDLLVCCLSGWVGQYRSLPVRRKLKPSSSVRSARCIEPLFATKVKEIRSGDRSRLETVIAWVI